VQVYVDAKVELERGDASASWVAMLVNINDWFIATCSRRRLARRF
jgi:hypothetical protein